VKIVSESKIRQLAVKQVNLPSVYVSNGLTMEPEDDAIWEHILTKVEELIGTKSNEYFECAHALVDSGLFFFETMFQARQFYKIFNDVPVYSSGCYAELNDENGNCLDENT